MNKVIIAILVVPLSFITQVLIMRYGWGVHPQSWGIIIGGNIASWIIYGLMGAAK